MTSDELRKKIWRNSISNYMRMALRMVLGLLTIRLLFPKDVMGVTPVLPGGIWLLFPALEHHWLRDIDGFWFRPGGSEKGGGTFSS